MNFIKFIFALVCLFSFTSLAQTPKKSVYTVKREPGPKVSKDGKCKFKIKFVGADGKPHKSGARLTFNNDTIFPKIDSEGIYQGSFPEGKCKITAFVPYWNDIITDSILFKKGELITIRLKFEAKEIKIH
ncbi:MAG: hypothetical protein SGJ15_06655 [Bacteroidota bacterium]|nr:hypothetical protein [Bacteroidota bacterium]